MTPAAAASKIQMLTAVLKKLPVEYAVSYASSFLGFAIMMLVARILGAEQFAWVAAGNALGGFITPLTLLGSEMAFVRDAVALSDRGAIEAMAAKTFGMRVTVALAIFALLALGAPLCTHSISSGLATALLASWAGMQGLSAAAWFDYLRQTRQQNNIVLGERVVAVTLILGMLLLPPYAQTALVAGLILFVTRVLFVAVQVKRWTVICAGSGFRLRLAIPRRHIGNNMRVTAASLSNALLLYGNQLFLSNNPIELASYGVAFQIMGVIFVFQGQSARMLSRTIAETCKRGVGVSRSLLRGILLVAGGSALLALAGFVLIELLPQLLSDPKYAVAAKFAPLLCIWVVVAGASMVVVRYLIALQAESFYLALSISAGVGALILGALFVPKYGGLAVAAILVAVHLCIVSAGLLRVLENSAVARMSGRAG